MGRLHVTLFFYIIFLPFLYNSFNIEHGVRTKYTTDAMALTNLNYYIDLMVLIFSVRSIVVRGMLGYYRLNIQIM